MTKKGTFHQNIAMKPRFWLLAGALALACGCADARQESSDEPTQIAGPSRDAQAMNEVIVAGTTAFAEEHSIEGLWKLVERSKVGNIQSVSDDRSKVLFLAAATDRAGAMVPSGELVLADLVTGDVISLGKEQGLSLHTGALSPDGKSVAAVGGAKGHLFLADTSRGDLAIAMTNDGSVSVADLTWHPDSDRLGFILAPLVHMHDPAKGGELPAEGDIADVPGAKIAWLSTASGARGIVVDTVTVESDVLGQVPGLRWDGDTLVSAERQVRAAPALGTTEVVTKGYCAPSSMTRAGYYLNLKLPWNSGSSYLTSDDCNHSQRGDQLDFDFDGGPLHDGGAVLAVAAGKVIQMRSTVEDPSSWVCTNSTQPQANYVVVQHFGASNTAFTSLYWHLRRNPAIPVTLNQQVSQGTIVGYNGCTGRAYGEHLHFGMRVGSTFNYWGTEAVPEPIDGYSNLDAGGTYTSSNSSNTPPPPASDMLTREGSGYSLNGYSPYNGRELTVWASNPNDGDQKWDLLAPGTFGGNSGWMIRRTGTSYCVNAYDLYNYAPVNMWSCSGGDGDQQFDRIDYGSSVLYRRQGSNYCLNGHEMYNYGQVTLWPCNTGDIEQRWVIN